jgi:hypothetical protein
MRERQHWMDLFRGFAIILVITLHATTMPNIRGVDPLPWLREFFLFLTPLRVPLLFALSGMLLSRALKKPLIHYVRGKIRNLLWPFLLWGVITVLLVGKRSQFSDQWEWIGGFGHLWFLGTLLFCVALGWLVRFVPAWVLAVALPLLLTLNEPAEPVLRDYLFYGTFFFVGATLWQWRETIQSMRGWVPLLCSGVGVLGMVVTGDSPLTKFGPLGLLAPLPWFVAVIWAGPRMPRIPAVESMGRNSVIWYCAHFPALSLANRWATNQGMDGIGVNLVALAGGVLFPLLLVLGGRWTRLLFALPPIRRRTARTEPRTKLGGEEPPIPPQPQEIHVSHHP